MARAFGIVNLTNSHIHVNGMQDYRPIAAFSFLGRYRVIDFPISNMSNSDIERIQVYARGNVRSLAEHLGTGRHYNINSKRGKLQLLFTDNDPHNTIYNTDIAAISESLDMIRRMHENYVVIAPSNMLYSQDYNALLDTHIESGADITLLYHKVDNAKDSFVNCHVLDLNKQKGVQAIELNAGNTKDKNIFMDTYIMKKDLFIELVQRAKATSSMYTLADIVNTACEEMDVRGVAHRGFFAAITDLKSYIDANLALLDPKKAAALYNNDWPFYTKTTDSCPTQYFEGASVKNSFISNGCMIEGTVENSVIGRGVTIAKDAVVRNSIVLAYAEIDKDVHLENQIVDKWAKIRRAKEVIAPEDLPGYIRRDDIL